MRLKKILTNTLLITLVITLAAFVCGIIYIITSFMNMRTIHDIPYHSTPSLETISSGINSSARNQKMDLYLPHKQTKNTLVVFIYGSAWTAGSKSNYAFMGRYFTRLGYPTLIPDYRHYPDVVFPSFIDDVARAIRAARLLDSDDYGLEYDRIILVGHSAGAHTAATLITDPTYFSRYSVSTPVVAFIGIAGPYDLPFTEEVAPIFASAGASAQQRMKTNPYQMISNRDPSQIPQTLLLHGLSDTRVGPHHTENFTRAYAEIGAPAQTHMISHYNHIGIIGAYVPFFERFSEPSRRTKEFLSSLEE